MSKNPDVVLLEDMKVGSLPCGCRLVSQDSKKVEMFLCRTHKNAEKVKEEHTLMLGVLRAAYDALNWVPNTKLRGDYKDTYAVAAMCGSVLDKVQAVQVSG